MKTRQDQDQKPNFKEIERMVNRFKGETMDTWKDLTAQTIVNGTKK